VLTEVWHKVSSEIYAKAKPESSKSNTGHNEGPMGEQGKAPQNDPGKPFGNNDKVVDADFTVEDAK